jgi:hypothetical protein
MLTSARVRPTDVGFAKEPMPPYRRKGDSKAVLTKNQRLNGEKMKNAVGITLVSSNAVTTGMVTPCTPMILQGKNEHKKS